MWSVGRFRNEDVVVDVVDDGFIVDEGRTVVVVVVVVDILKIEDVVPAM